MIPVLYEKDEHRFSTHGLGSLPSWKELTVTEERADADFGEFVLEGIVPIGSQNADQIAEERIICAAAAPYRSYYNPVQPFRIRRVVKEGRDLHIFAQHVSYELRENIVKPTASMRFADLQYILDTVLNQSGSGTGFVVPPINGRFVFESDIVAPAPVQIDESQPLSVRAWLLDVQALFGGEFDWNGYAVQLKAARGANRGVEITYGVNLGGCEYTTDTEGLVTGYYGWWRDSQSGAFTDAIVYKANAADYAYTRVAPVDLSSELEPAEGQLIPTAAAMEAALTAYADGQHANFIPQSITFTAVPEALQGVWLCDTVTVLHPVFQLKAESKIVKTVYDPIRERYTAVTIGEIQRSVTDTLAAMLQGRINYAKRT